MFHEKVKGGHFRQLPWLGAMIDAVKALINSPGRVDVPPLAPPVVDLSAYDDLLAEVGT